MGRKMNFFLSALLVLLFGMGLSTCSLASSGDLNYRDDPATDLNINTLNAVFDYFISIQTTFGTNAYMTNQISSFYNSIDKTTLLNTIKAQITDDFGEIQNLVFSVSRINNSSFYFYVFANNNTVGDLPHTRLYLKDNGWLYNQVYAKQFDTLEDGTHQDLSNFIGVRFICRNTGVMSVSNDFSGVFSDSSLKIVKNFDSSTANFGGILSLSPIASFYTITTTNTSSYEWLIASNYIDLPTRTIIPDEPDNPDNPDEPGDNGTTGTITNPSGEETGKVDLSGIEQGIGNINQNIDKTNEKLDGISGEIGKLNENLTTVPNLSDKTITSGDITDAFDFEFAEDPYANFWLELTTGLSGALTNNVRSIDIQFRDKTYNIELDNFAIQTPEFLKSFLAILSTVFIFWKMIKYWKIIIDNITSGNMDEVLEMNEEERYY